MADEIRSTMAPRRLFGDVDDRPTYRTTLTPRRTVGGVSPRLGYRWSLHPRTEYTATLGEQPWLH